MSILASRLKLLRERKGWTKTYVAEKLGIKTLSTYANYEYALREPDNETLIRIAELYEVSIDYLLGIETKHTNHSDLVEFEKWINDPQSNIFFKEFIESPEERREALLQMWEILKKQK